MKEEGAQGEVLPERERKSVNFVRSEIGSEVRSSITLRRDEAHGKSVSHAEWRACSKSADKRKSRRISIQSSNYYPMLPYSAAYPSSFTTESEVFRDKWDLRKVEGKRKIFVPVTGRPCPCTESYERGETSSTCRQDREVCDGRNSNRKCRLRLPLRPRMDPWLWFDNSHRQELQRRSSFESSCDQELSILGNREWGQVLQICPPDAIYPKRPKYPGTLVSVMGSFRPWHGNWLRFFASGGVPY